MSSIKRELESDLVWTVAARVGLHEGESVHYAVNAEGQLTVSVLTLTHGVPIWANLRGGDAASHGTWTIPAIDTEVLVGFDGGEFEGEAYIAGLYGAAPAGLAPGKVFILADEIQIRSVDGTARALAFKDELVAVDNKYAGHLHPQAGTTPVSAVFPNPAYPVTDPVNPYLPTGTPLGDAGVVGTTKLKAE